MTKKAANCRTPFNYDTDVVSFSTGLKCEDVSRTKQAPLAECDINTIVKRFNATGVAPVSPVPPEYGDFTGVSDYQTALHALMDAQATFDDLPADIRKRFSNDPGEFVDFVTNPDNISEVRKMGLAPALPVDLAEPESGLPASAKGDPKPAATPAE